MKAISRFSEKYCPKCKKSGTFYYSPADSKYACMGPNGRGMGCTGRFTNEELDEAFLSIHKDKVIIRPFDRPYQVKIVGVSDVKSEGGSKFDDGKPRMDLLETEYIEEIAKVMTFGAKKYAAHNWRKGLAVGRCLAAATRHIFAYIRGEDNDPESGLSHLGHAGCCLMFAFWMKKNKPELDDRYVSEKTK